MNASAKHSWKIGILEWLLLAYLLIGGIWAVVALSTNGDRFAAFVIYGFYALPSTMLVSASGLGEVLFADWPNAIYWTVTLVIVNGVGLYAVAKIAVAGWRRNRRHRLEGPQ